MIKELFNTKKKHLLIVPIHGTRLHFYCDQKVLLNDIRLHLRYFINRKGAVKGGSANCYIDILEENDYKQYQNLYTAHKIFEASPGIMATLGSIYLYTVYELKSCCLLLFDDKTNECACLLRRSANKKLISTDLIIHILLIEWLRGKGLFFIHSSGVCRGEKAYLFIGPSGSGKTAAALMGIQRQRGLSFMGDDLLILRGNGRTITVHSYIEDVKFCIDMIGKFYELKTIELEVGSVHRNKKTIKFDVKKYFDVEITDRALVRKIFFLQGGQTLKLLKPSDALPLLMNSSFFYSRQDVSIKHFELLCRLIYSVDSYLVGRNYINRHFEKLIG
jgi:hypothetical protein